MEELFSIGHYSPHRGTIFLQVEYRWLTPVRDHTIEESRLWLCFIYLFFCLLFGQNFGYVYILYKKESCKLNSCEWFLDRPVYFLNEWIPVMGLHVVGTKTSWYSQVFCALTDCQRDPRVLGCHKNIVKN